METRQSQRERLKRQALFEIEVTPGKDKLPRSVRRSMAREESKRLYKIINEKK